MITYVLFLKQIEMEIRHDKPQNHQEPTNQGLLKKPSRVWHALTFWSLPQS